MTVRLWLLIGTIGLACGSAPSAAQTTEDLCARLSVPDGAGLACVVLAIPQDRPGRGGATNRQRLRPAQRTDPASCGGPTRTPPAAPALTLDLSPVDAALNELIHGADSPITGTPLAEQLQSWRGLLGAAATLPLTGCGSPHRLAGGTDGGKWRAVGTGRAAPIHAVPPGRRAGDHMGSDRTMNEQRLRHLLAIANSF